MKLYARNNIVATRYNDMFYISEVGDEYLHLLNSEQDNYTLIEKADIYIKDIEMSDWVLDELFKRNYYYNANKEEWYWDIDNREYMIEKEHEGLYCLSRGSNILMYFDTVRELQNAYHFYSDYEEEKLLNEDIDTKLKKLFKLI